MKAFDPIDTEALIQAIEKDETQKSLDLISNRKPNILAPGASGKIPFQLAINKGNIPVVKRMLEALSALEHSVDVGKVLASNRNALLLMSVMAGDVDFVRQLLSYPTVSNRVTVNANAALRSALSQPSNPAFKQIAEILKEIDTVKNFELNDSDIDRLFKEHFYSALEMHKRFNKLDYETLRKFAETLRDWKQLGVLDVNAPDKVSILKLTENEINSFINYCRTMFGSEKMQVWEPYIRELGEAQPIRLSMMAEKTDLDMILTLCESLLLEKTPQFTEKTKATAADEHIQREKEKRHAKDTIEDYYLLLGLKKNATDIEIGKAVRATKSRGATEIPPNGTLIMKASEAYAILMDRELRQIYDQHHPLADAGYSSGPQAPRPSTTPQYAQSPQDRDRQLAQTTIDDLYQLLSINRKATPQEIDTAFQLIIDALKSDELFAGLDPATRVLLQSPTTLTALNNAYRILRDPILREIYNKAHPQAGAPQEQRPSPALKYESGEDKRLRELASETEDDYYEFIGTKREANPEEIERAIKKYRELLNELISIKPKLKTDPQSSRANATFNDAIRILRDRNLREIYDKAHPQAGLKKKYGPGH